ncbi:MAG: SAM-dependent methyltransferase [Planctomycetota bacterium]|jgi:SAM-dependent methyltransferase
MTIRQNFMAWSYDRTMARYESDAGPRRTALLVDLGLRIVELGPGSGVNLKYMWDATGAAPDLEWIGVEPSAPMRERLLARAATDCPDLRLRFAEQQEGVIDIESGWADTVICTLVLCSVPDQAAVLSEAHRILKPGGRLLFMEHVAAPRGSLLRAVQIVVTPFWTLLSDGCKLNRDTGEALRQAGFRELELVHYKTHPGAMPFFVRPHIHGSALK